MRRLRQGDDAVLELNQPVHRRFQIALFEAFCAQPGSPRLDPAKIASSGIVIRRLRSGRREGWMKRGKSIDGWTRIADNNADPDPAKAAVHPANLAIRQAIAVRKGKPQGPAAETVHGLYPAPPDVCAAVGKTVLFAAIPVCSAETADTPADAIDYNALQGQDRTDMVLHLSGYLKDRPERAMPRSQEPLDRNWNVLDATTLASDPNLSTLGTFLHQMTVELDALGPSTASAALMTVLGEITLPMTEDIEAGVTSSVSAADFVRKAGPILIGREGNGSGFAMPIRWPEVAPDLGTRLTNAALACLSEQYKARVGPPGKFADDNAEYVVRGFMRVVGHDGCPDKLVWSMESERFRILPWWDGEGPGTTISLPSIGNLKKVKPSVAFSMPPEIGNLLKGNLEDLAKGKGEEDTSGIAWLCSFSIPFITLCAFICLNIFLGLFDLIFRWMMWIKICIPIPKSGK
jgi:hypothetical protein